VLLLLLAAAFFGAEAFVTSHGALALAGAVSFVVGALMLFDPAGPEYQVSIWVALAVGGTLAILTAIAVTKVVQARRAPKRTGREELIGEIGVVRRPLQPAGLVAVHGELWQARSSDGSIATGERVRVEAIGDDLVLEVARVEARAPVPA
jgi:membrane-bound serine protease (ClpP class)